MNDSGNPFLNVVIVAPIPPPFGGMANQAFLLKKLLEKERVCVTIIPTNRSTETIERFVGNIPAIRTLLREVVFLWRLISGCRPTAIIYILGCSHLYYFFNVIPAVIIGKILSNRVIVNYRGGEAEDFFHNFGKRFLWVLKQADFVTVPSAFLKKVFERFGVRSLVLPNIIDLDLFQHRKPSQRRGDRFICTRNFEPYYDVETAVRAFKLAKEKIQGAKLTLIGDGSLRTAIEHIIKALSLEEDVTLLGKIDPAKIPAHLAQSDIFINPSRVDNYPNSILEAFAVGVPVVTTSAGGIPYLVQDQRDVLMVDPGDYQALAMNMVRLAGDRELCHRLSISGKETADKHSWEKIWPQMKHIFWELV
ncbi:MAG: glycosyltransferase family 4 protein [Desulfobacterales bacterium]|jgi:glycosyltransferase involved in cell wall biosynthesis|nr:glycosyltransferase family 4 protein [Desulfobacterales bacterium]